MAGWIVGESADAAVSNVIAANSLRFRHSARIASCMPYESYSRARPLLP